MTSFFTKQIKSRREIRYFTANRQKIKYEINEKTFFQYTIYNIILIKILVNLNNGIFENR